MSYLVYINGQQIETYKGNAIALTKQNNDIGDVTTRNANFSQNIKIPKTSNNTKVLESAGLISKNSNFPYKINDAQIVDENTGVHLVRNGFAVLLNTDKDYNLTIYDGTINFFKAIENLTLTAVGLEDLNHIKNIDNIIETWTDTSLPYRYNLADYNGKLFTNLSELNVDYQVPSASVKYLWERIFDFIGFSYQGAIFDNEEFKDLWLSYPKPVPTDAPDIDEITLQNSIIDVTTIEYPVGNSGIFIGSSFIPRLLPDPINTPFIESTPIQTILQNGAYRIQINGSFTSTNDFNNQVFVSEFVRFTLRDALGVVVQNVVIQSGIDFVFNALQGYNFNIFVLRENSITSQAMTGGSFPTNFINVEGGMTTRIDKINGYTLGFDQAFIDFKVSDFIKEIMVRFSLTPFEIKNTNTIKFLTLDEIFQDDNVQDWSDKFHGQTNESYKLNRYAQNNQFKFKYNDTNFKHNDGRILIDNKNLAEETTLYNSRTFAPEPKLSDYLSFNIYKIWDKTVKDDGEVEYKDLDNRFYFMRSERKNTPINLGSEILGLSQIAPFYYRENYFRCSWQRLINKWYQNINKLLDFTKVVTANIYLKSFEFANLQMDKMVYIGQLSSYFLINKVQNFIPDKLTKVELIKVEYFSEPVIDFTPSNPIISIISYEIVGCTIIFTVATQNITQPVQVELLLFRETFSIPNSVQIQTVTPIYGILNNNQVTFDLSQIPYSPLPTWVQIVGFTNVFLPFQTAFPSVGGAGGINLPDGCFVVPNLPDDLTVLKAVYLGIQFNGFFNVHAYKIIYDFSELELNQINYTIFTEVYVNVANDFYPIGWEGVGNTQMNINDLKEITVQLPVLLSPETINKIRISINNQLSNEYNL